MLQEEFKSENYQLKLHIKELIKEIPSLNIDVLKKLGYDIDVEEENERGMGFFAKPNAVELPFIKVLKTKTVKSEIVTFTVAWTCLDEEGNIPEGVSSKTAYRVNAPAIINGKIKEDGTFAFNEVLYSENNNFERFIFNKNGEYVTEYWFYLKDSKAEKVYELKKPFYIKYFESGLPSEVWYSNPKATHFTQTNCTLRQKDDHPVVLSFYSNGDLEKVDYTGYVFSDKSVPQSINNYPFHSRFKFYLPSYYYFSRKNEDGYQRTIETAYFIRKDKLSEEEALAIVGNWGVDISSPEIIEQTLNENPFFEENIRSMMGIALISDEELDDTLMLHENV